MEILENLQKRGFKAYFIENGEEALKIIKDNIPFGSTIGFGGSMTLEALQFPQKLAAAGYTCNHASVSDKDGATLREENRFVKYYLTSTNAITVDGLLVNTDGRSNRVSAMCYGPSKLFFVLGKNKICKDLDAAFLRIENIAAPLNAKRLNKKTPCAVTGKCMHCQSPDTICKTTLILRHPAGTMEVFVIIINKELGY